ncbi:TlpA family protein disulfide reductase [Anatilimnocola sp. NA78]|uniref:TlpA family protein disulfide reductase n=1 Tax=Anatilimnocola sp. NA78 TaxID=3415683 RepID=UPI003CE4FC3F
MLRAYSIALLALAGLSFTLPPLAAAQDAAPAAQGLSSELPEGKDAAEVFAAIQKQLFANARKGPEAFEAFGKQRDAFYKKFVDDPVRWELKMLDFQVLGATGKTDEAMALIAEVEAAKDAPEKIKATASAMQVQRRGMDAMSGKLKLEEFTALAEAHLKKYPTAQANRQVAYMLVEATAAAEPTAAAEERLVALSHNSYTAIADLAEKKLKVVRIRKELASKPLELSFTAVDGREVDFAKLRGKVVLIDFWATWCGPCMAEVPNVVQTYKKLNDKGFEIVGISLDSDKEKLIQVAKENEMSWPHQFDGKGWENELAQKYGVQSIPEMWLVNKKGIMKVFNRSNDLAGEIEKLLAE